MAAQKKKTRILLACGDDAFCRLAEAQLRGMQQAELIAVARDGVETVSQAVRFRPELAFIDSDLTLCDGMTAIRQIRQKDKQMGVLLLSSFTGRDIGAQCEAFDVSNIILKPVLPEMLCEQVLVWQEGRKRLARRSQTTDYRKRVCRFLHTVCMPENIKGYYYIADGVVLILENGEQSFSATKWLYPKLATMDRQGATPESVERDIRYAIETTWTHTALSVLEDLFQQTSLMHDDHPTNSRFLSAVASIIRNEMDRDVEEAPRTTDEN